MQLLSHLGKRCQRIEVGFRGLLALDETGHSQLGRVVRETYTVDRNVG